MLWYNCTGRIPTGSESGIADVVDKLKNINGCEMMLVWCQYERSEKIHLNKDTRVNDQKSF